MFLFDNVIFLSVSVHNLSVFCYIPLSCICLRGKRVVSK